MKRILSILVVLAIAMQLQAQSNAPVRLAIVPEMAEAGTVADVLTAEFSKNQQVHLLERAEIERVYREQGLSAGNRDYLKLGQILGADGLLLLGTSGEGTNQFLNVRLIAVKPGVVLVADKFAWLAKDPTGWSAIFAGHLAVFLPKLTVLVKDAIPISIVNLRSAVNSAEAGETEQQLKLLTIQRLSREPQLFVLERQRMQLLTEEKDLKLDDSAFWNGSYLLEGVVDQNGYSKETITINARLTPPKGGAPLVFEVSGSRTNLPEVVNQLAAKVTEALKVNATVKAWNAADEAAQYFDEAKWAFKWALYQEAQSAAESAWALGKQDMDCAIIRIRSYEKPSTAMTTSGEVIDRGLINDPEKSERDSVIKDIKDIVSIHPGAVFQFLPAGLVCTTIENSPDPQQLARLNRAVEIYRAFSQNFRVDDLKPDSIWYQLGVEVLGSAARTLQHFYLVPQSQAEVADRLVELRSKARWIDEWITQSPSVHDSFFAENPDPDKEWRMLTYGANIYSCEVNWGCFWQEKPEDCVALYRGLLKSPAFHFFTDEIGGSPARISNHRELESPLVVAWNKGDRMRIQNIWDNFIQDLDNSTNLFLQKESKNFRDIATPAGLNEEEIISQYLEYWQDIQAAKMNGVLPGSQEQKEAPDLTSDINELMSTDSTTASMAQKAQALELKPRLVVYKANLIQKMQVKSSAARRNLMMEVNAITGVQSRVESTLNATPPKAVLKTDITLPTSNPVEARANTAGTSSEVTNVLFVRNYLAIPTDNLPSDNGTLQTVRIIDSRWSEGKLLLNLWWGQNPTVGLPLPAIASAIFDPTNKSWETILYPTNDSGTLSDIESMELFHGVLYVVRTEDAILDGNEVGYKERILKYDAPLRQWQALEIPMQDIFKNQWSHTRLWVVNDHLYGVNPTSIFETTSDDKEFRLLASTRRRPAASLLDSLSDLGSPVLFSGPNRSLCVSLGNASFGWEQNKTFQWDGNDWHELFALKISQPPETFEDAVVYRYAKLDYMNNPSMVWFWDKHQAAPELALYGEPKRPRPNLPGVNRAAQTTSPLWRSLGNDVLAKASVAYFKSNLFLYVDQVGIGHLPNGTPIPERSSDDADLICLDRDCPQPIVIPLKYDSARGPLPWAGTWPSLSPVWMTFTSDSLLIGNKDVAGIWAIPLAELNAAVAKQKQALPVPNGSQQDTKP